MARENDSLRHPLQGENQAVEAVRPRLSQQQKDWIIENINRLKAPIVVSDAPQTDPK